MSSSRGRSWFGTTRTTSLDGAQPVASPAQPISPAQSNPGTRRARVMTMSSGLPRASERPELSGFRGPLIQSK